MSSPVHTVTVRGPSLVAPVQIATCPAAASATAMTASIIGGLGR
jgi:hypothetical protein